MNRHNLVIRALTLIPALVMGVFTHSVWGAATVTGINLVSSTRTGRTTFDYTYTINVQAGSTSLNSAVATVTSNDPNTVVLKGSVSLGSLLFNSATTSTDTFTIQQNREVPFNPAALQWTIAGTLVPGAPRAIIDAPSPVLSDSSVVLDGTPSADATASIASYSWRQVSGPTITLANANTSRASFIAPHGNFSAPLSFKLTVADSAGGVADATADVNILPRRVTQTVPSFVALTFLAPVSPPGHSNVIPLDGPPLADAHGILISAMLSGPIATAAFSVIDRFGDVIGTPQLQLSGLATGLVIDYVGTINVPTIPFYVVASGVTGNGKPFSVRSPSLISPMNMTIAFTPSRVLLQRGASASTTLQIYNAGNTAIFGVHFSAPPGALSGPSTLSIQVPGGQSSSVPATVEFPTALLNTGVITISATVAVAGDPQRTGNTTLNIALDGTP